MNNAKKYSHPLCPSTATNCPFFMSSEMFESTSVMLSSFSYPNETSFRDIIISCKFTTLIYLKVAIAVEPQGRATGELSTGSPISSAEMTASYFLPTVLDKRYAITDGESPVV